MSQTPDDDWLAGERERHGSVTEEESHAAYDAVLDARASWRKADKQSGHEPADTTGIEPPSVSELHIEPPDD